jgi:hypothetical protein
MMIFNYTPKRIIAGSALTASLATYYTALTTYGTILKELMLVNTDSVARAVSVHIVPGAGTAGVPTTVISAETLQPGEQRVYSLSTVLPLNSFIQASAATAAVVAISASGVEIS